MTPHLLGHIHDSAIDNRVQVSWKHMKVCENSDLLLPKTLTKKVNDSKWTLDDLLPHIYWSYMCDSTQVSLYPSFMKINKRKTYCVLCHHGLWMMQVEIWPWSHTCWGLHGSNWTPSLQMSQILDFLTFDPCYIH